MSVGEIKAGLAVADASVMVAAEIANGISRQVDTMPLLEVATQIEEIPSQPAWKVASSFERAGEWMALMVNSTAKNFHIGGLAEAIDTATGRYAEPLAGADRNQEPVSSIFGGLEHMAGKTTELADGNEVFIEDTRSEQAALYAAAAAVREQVSGEDFEAIAQYVAAEAAERAAAVRDKLEPTRASLKPIADEISGTASDVKASSQEFATRLG